MKIYWFQHQTTKGFETNVSKIYNIFTVFLSEITKLQFTVANYTPHNHTFQNFQTFLIMILPIGMKCRGLASISRSGNTNCRGRLSTVDLLIKVGCFVKKVNNIFNIKRNWSKLVTTRRSIEMSLSRSIKDFPGSFYFLLLFPGRELISWAGPSMLSQYLFGCNLTQTTPTLKYNAQFFMHTPFRIWPKLWTDTLHWVSSLSVFAYTWLSFELILPN
jgi:hypothetical protein